MLIKNQITELLYEYEFKGLENIYDYWMKNRSALITYIDKHQHRIHAYEETMKAFELKVRWSSYYGLWYRFHVGLYLDCNKGALVFDDIEITYGGQKMLLADFLPIISNFHSPIEATPLIDLRGISLLKVTATSSVIEGIDFSYAALNGSRFKEITFKNCRFHKTSFYGCNFRECVFDESCVLVENDFSNAYIHGDFLCSVIEPTTNQQSLKERLLSKNDEGGTRIKSKSFKKMRINKA